MTLHMPRLKQQAQIRRLPDQITINHGPREQLGRFFLEADKAARDRGVTLSLSTDFEMLREVNARNKDSWYDGLPPSFDPAYGAVDASNSYWIMGRDDTGEVVTTQAARLFNIEEGETLADLFTSLNLFYPDPARHARPGETCTITAPNATKIAGVVLHSGCSWVHPRFRRRHMMFILPRISRALGLTRWNTEYTFSFVSEKLVNYGVADAYGYTRIEPLIDWRNCLVGNYQGMLVWMPRQELIADMQMFPAQLEKPDGKPVRPQTDTAVQVPARN